MPKRDLAPSAAPPNAIPLWTDGHSLYTELPGPDLTPYVIRYPRTVSGLQSALNIISTHAYDGASVQTPVLERQLNAKAELRKLRLIP